MAEYAGLTQEQIDAKSKKTIRKIWMTALILGLVTAVEFVFAFWLGHEYKWLKISIFIGLTIVKAFYIVAEFVHLKHEMKVLIWSILLPMIFAVWLIIAMLVEADTIFGIRF
jgi:cytochrome c oxidase subunit IV